MRDSAFQELLDEFLLEARERADEVETAMLSLEAVAQSERRELLAQAKRQLHTLKGNSGMMGYGDLQRLAHDLEDRVEQLDLEQPRVDDILAGLDQLRQQLAEIRSQDEGPVAAEPAAAPEESPAPAGAEAVEVASALDAGGGSVRLSFSKIDQIVEMLAETLIYRNRLGDAIGAGARIGAEEREPEALVARWSAAWDEVEGAHQALEKTLNLLQELVTELGMVPLQGLFRSLRRLVHDESAQTDKRVEIEIDGGDTPIDKTLLEVAGEALGHLVRNAVIHGIEPPAERRRRHKPEVGHVRLGASIEGGEVRIEVSDDGGGIDLEALRSRARELGIEGAESGGYHLLFEDGVTTRSGADLSAGRGVGMSAVKRSVERHGGRIEVVSVAGRGSAFTLRLPVTASILRSLLVAVDSEEYALPLASVVETVQLDVGDRHRLHHAGVLRWRSQVIPLLDLGLLFGTAGRPRENGFVLLIDVGDRRRGLVVDDIVGIRDIVVKGLDSIVGQPPGIAGSTILGDGRVIMILDAASLASTQPFVEGQP